MFKISWGRKSDKHQRTFVVVPDVYSLFEIWHVINGYGRDDGLSPIDVTATNLDGQQVDMTSGISGVAPYATRINR